VIEVDRERRIVRTKSGKELGYHKLILATGADPFVPNIPGKDLSGVYTIIKDPDYLRKLHEDIKRARSVVIVGGVGNIIGTAAGG